jgi:hypothetical protein
MLRRPDQKQPKTGFWPFFGRAFGLEDRILFASPRWWIHEENRACLSHRRVVSPHAAASAREQRVNSDFLVGGRRGIDHGDSISFSS